MNYKKNQGFTLVELMLAMTFIAMLLLAIAMLTLQVSKIYNKGLSLRAVNEAGQLLSSELQRTLNTSSLNTVESVEVADKGGRLCANGVVYAWRYQEEVGGSDINTLNVFPDTSEKTDIRFIKFTGSASEYCKETAGLYKSLPLRKDTTEMLKGGNADLVVRKFGITTTYPVLDDAKQAIYQINLTLGTKTVDLITNDRCEPPEGGGDEYCAVNDFSFTARAGRNN